MKVEVAVLGSPVPNKPKVSVDVKQHFSKVSVRLLLLLGFFLVFSFFFFGCC